MVEFAAKALWAVIVAGFILGGWVTRLQVIQASHSAVIEEQNGDLKEISKNVNYIKGWVEAQPKPKRRGE